MCSNVPVPCVPTGFVILDRSSSLRDGWVLANTLSQAAGDGGFTILVGSLPVIVEDALVSVC